MTQSPLATQKSAKARRNYFLYINSPLGCQLAAVADRAGLSHNQVTYLSALMTFGGLVLLALAPAGWLTGFREATALILGYPLDSADGQLARRQGAKQPGRGVAGPHDRLGQGGRGARGRTGHPVPQLRLAGSVAAVAVMFAIASSTHFFGMILVDQLTGVRRAGRSPTA
jgi:hypothetical protein